MIINNEVMLSHPAFRKWKPLDLSMGSIRHELNVFNADKVKFVHFFNP